MRRRANKEASYRNIVKHGISYVEGRIAINGEQISRYGKTRAECVKKIDALKFNGVPKKPSKITVKDNIDNWLKTEIEPNKGEETYLNYDGICQKHIIPELGKDKVTDLNGERIEAFIEKKKKYIIKTKNTSRQISTRTVKLIRFLLKASLDYAVTKKIIDSNPVPKMKIAKKQKKDTANMDNFLLPEEVESILSIDTTSDSLEALNKFILIFALRRGEGRIAKWSDINFRDKSYMVRGTKTKKSKRILPLYDLAIDFLKEWKAAQKDSILLFGDTYNNQGYIFTNDKGDPFYPDSIRKGLERLLKKAEINKKITVHGLRHSMATYLLSIGVAMELVQQILGHESIETTIDTYSHIYLGLKRKVADIFNEKVKIKN